MSNGIGYDVAQMLVDEINFLRREQGREVIVIQHETPVVLAIVPVNVEQDA